MSWEIDIFGKITSAVKQSRAQYRASKGRVGRCYGEHGRRDSSTYVQLRVWEAELAVAQEHAVAQDSISKLCSTDTNVDWVPSHWLTSLWPYCTVPRATTGAAHIHRHCQELAGMLVARYPEEINALLDSQSDLPDYRQIVATGMPGELLRRRPDIIAAEQNLARSRSCGYSQERPSPTLSTNGSIGLPALN